MLIIFNLLALFILNNSILSNYNSIKYILYFFCSHNYIQGAINFILICNLYILINYLII